MLDVDSLPPTQLLILEVLAARTRLGEHFWTFADRRLGTALRALSQLGLIDICDDVKASLTADGRAAMLYGDYTIPDVQRQRDEAQATLRKVAEYAVNRRHDELLNLLTTKAEA